MEIVIVGIVCSIGCWPDVSGRKPPPWRAWGEPWCGAGRHWDPWSGSLLSLFEHDFPPLSSHTDSDKVKAEDDPFKETNFRQLSLPTNCSAANGYQWKAIEKLNLCFMFYLNKSLYYSIELYSLFPPLGFISNYRIMLGDIKIWGQELTRAVLAVC